jgi:site-specific DNA-methyltransferase (adenine-specific)
MIDKKASKPKDQLSGASRFFYCAKASKSERNAGCEDLEQKAMTELDKIGGEKSNFKTGSGKDRNILNSNNHPTVKPLSLMTYLTKLVKMPENTLILDPFAGSGSTLLGCIRNNINFIGIDLDESYCDIAKHRIIHCMENSESERSQLTLDL